LDRPAAGTVPYVFTQACPRELFQNLPNLSLETKNLGSRQGGPDFGWWSFGLRMQVSAGMEGCFETRAG